MICRNCGKVLEEGELFCPDCGTKAEAVTESLIQDNSSDAPYSSASYTAEPQVNQYAQGMYNTQPAPAQSAPAKQKEFFGRGAFILCLIVIAILSGTAGAFVYLYFSLLGTI